MLQKSQTKRALPVVTRRDVIACKPLIRHQALFFNQIEGIFFFSFCVHCTQLGWDLDLNENNDDL